MNEVMDTLLAMLGAYLLGTLPVGRMVGLIGFGEDILEYRDGTAGFSNLFHVLGVEAGLGKVALELAKGITLGMLLQKEGAGSPLLPALCLLMLMAGCLRPFGFPGKEGSPALAGFGMIWYLAHSTGGFSLAMFTAVLLFRRKLRPAVSTAMAALVLAALWQWSVQIGTCGLLAAGCWFRTVTCRRQDA